jgi:RsiW-degrading membrane proteinase PrsW (M82 family)
MRHHRYEPRGPATHGTAYNSSSPAVPHVDGFGPAIKDADVDRDDIAATILVAFDGTVAGLEAALTDAGLPAAVTVRQPDAIAAGALHITSIHGGPAGAEPTAATVRLPRTRLTVRSLTATAVLAVCSVALLLQTVATADISTIATRVVGVRLPIENVALAAAVAATTAIAAAQVAPTTWLSPKGLADTTSTGILLRRCYLAAAAAGLALAGLWGLGVGVGVGYTSDSYVRRALTAAAPIAACAVVIALVSPRIPASRLAGWLTSMRIPVWAIAVAMLPMVFVALIEETAKLLVPAAVLAFWWRRRRDPSDGLVIGVAAGMGFAALETMGYAFTALLASKGDIGAVEQALFVRGLMAPAGHTAWTGLTCGALWAFAARSTGRRFLILLATFAGAVTLHTLWDSLGFTLAYVLLGVASVGWLLVDIRRYRTFQPAVAASGARVA